MTLDDHAPGALGSVGRAWRRPAHGAQQAFRTLLQAQSFPGRVCRFTGDAVNGLQPPATRAPSAVPGLSGMPDVPDVPDVLDAPALPGAMGLAQAVSLLTLLDTETPLHLAGALASAAARTWLRFHGGVPVTAEPAQSAYAACLAADCLPALWTALAGGTDDQPQDGATLLIDVPALADQAPVPGAATLRLSGPGIRGAAHLAVAGLPPAFWAWRRSLQAHYPCGVDLLLSCGDRVAAIPRSSHITWEV